MASVSRSRPTTNERSGAGGKIVRGRQIAAARARTPYDRPVAASGAPSPNPNWLTGLIFPTSRIIATGATKIFSSVFGPETSSSSSSSGTDSSSEDGMDDGNDDYDVPYDNGGRLDETGATSELIECFGSEPQLTAGKSEIKHVIEKLVMQETFSRSKEPDLGGGFWGLISCGVRGGAGYQLFSSSAPVASFWFWCGIATNPDKFKAVGEWPIPKFIPEAKQRYSTYDMEFYAVVRSIRLWRYYLLPQELVLYSDLQAFEVHSVSKTFEIRIPAYQVNAEPSRDCTKSCKHKAAFYAIGPHRERKWAICCLVSSVLPNILKSSWEKPGGNGPGMYPCWVGLCDHPKALVILLFSLLYLLLHHVIDHGHEHWVHITAHRAAKKFPSGFELCSSSPTSVIITEMTFAMLLGSLLVEDDDSLFVEDDEYNKIEPSLFAPSFIVNTFGRNFLAIDLVIVPGIGIELPRAFLMAPITLAATNFCYPFLRAIFLLCLCLVGFEALVGVFDDGTVLHRCPLLSSFRNLNGVLRLCDQKTQCLGHGLRNPISALESGALVINLPVEVSDADYEINPLSSAPVLRFRKECDRLIEIIKSRVIDGSTMEEEKDGTLGGIPNRTIGDVTPELCSKAVMEAKQWLEEKKVASSSKSGMDRGTCTLSSIARSQQKVYSLSSGSWNIQEEIRKVRSKATEDMLKTSARIDLPSYAWERKSLDESLLADEKDWEGGAKVHNFDLFPATGSISASLELAAGAITSHGLPASALELTHNISWEEDFTSQPIFSSSAQIQDLEGIQPVEGEGHAGSNSRLPTIPDPAVEHVNPSTDSRTYSADKEETELRGNPNTNGFCISRSSFGAGDDEQTLRSSHDTSPKPVGSNRDNLVNIVPMEETCELLSEASMEVPVIYETNSSAAAGGSQGSCTMQCEELSHEPSQPNLEDSLVGKTSPTVEKQQGRKLSSRYNRKSRGKR
ncbi:hypothetical protein RHSIM_Rhsim09G0061700 [Rhododendron simsii]|uniref:Reverse transcriptase RNase H-like domain-containing protein n=1 Tax=Rhododendron simsii TaxID=118357 RepID=A0A834GFE4_RHOSS|nr:hypothetical protein RHSIM_Rhsim09G0061700 [Rhododendron simsii]